VLMEGVATADLWSRPSVANNSAWQLRLEATLGIVTPSWAWLHSTCATHGDMTLCNTMRHPERGVVLVDPVYPERVPSIRQIDQARILQSMLGWEIMTGHQSEVIEWNVPSFILDSDIRVVAFWTYVMMARIVSSTTITEQERGWASHLQAELGCAL
jgi:hypothetical protein